MTADVINLATANGTTPSAPAVTTAPEAAAAKAAPPSEWTEMAEAISYISATLGFTFDTAQGASLWWSQPDLCAKHGGWLLELENIGDDEVAITVYLGETLEPKLLQIAGWALYKDIEVEVLSS